MEQCAHHVTSETMPSCDDVTQVQPTCNSTCVDDASRIYADDKHYSKNDYWLGGISGIKSDIYTYGSATAAFSVYEDFLTYK